LLATAVATCIFAIGMAGFLNYFKFRNTVADTVQSRLLVIGGSVARSVESSLALGLSFAEISTVPALIQREKAVDQLIESVALFDTSGRILYSTSANQLGTHVAEQWKMDVVASDGKPHWRTDEGKYSVVGVGIENSFGVTVGQVAIRYSRASIESSSAAMGQQLLQLAGIGILGSLLFVAALLGTVLRRFLGRLDTLENAIKNVGGPTSGGDAPHLPPEVSKPLEEALNELEDLARQLPKKEPR
jgi:sensor histidine kinase regulating citrate/malate metabolism